MTREEREQALEWFKNRPITMPGAKKMYDLAISALEQPEPCEDCISRQAAIDGADAIIARDTSGNNDVVKAMTAWKSYVEALPSAQQQRSRGRWESYLTNGLRYKCSECGSRYTIPWHFCPNCGSDNRGDTDET